MTDIAHESPRSPLGVGRIIGDTFSILFRKLPVILLLGFVPSLIQLLIVSLLPGQVASQIEAGEVAFDSSAFVMTFVAIILVSLVMSGIVTAAMVQLAYDSKLSRPVRIGSYVAAAIRNLPAIISLSIVSTVLFMAGWMLLIVPGLWLMSVFSVFVPAIVIEGAGFRGLGRSARLTRSYRWPIVGTMVLIFICLVLIATVVGAAIGLVSGVVFGGFAYIGLVLEAVLNGLTYGIFSITVALIFARLKEIKEGIGVADLVEVFR